MEKQPPRKRKFPFLQMLVVSSILFVGNCAHLIWTSAITPNSETAAMMDSARRGNVVGVLETLDYGNVNLDATYDGGGTALWHAAKRNDLAMVKLLVESGADPFKKNNGLTPRESSTSAKCSEILNAAEIAWRKRKS